MEHYRQLLASGYLESAVQGQERERECTQKQIRGTETRRIFNFPSNDRLLIRYSQEVSKYRIYTLCYVFELYL